MFPEQITFVSAFIAGLASFLSPCVFALVPAFFTFITGLSLDELTDSQKTAETRRKIVLATLAYVAGFSFVFIMMGASASFLGSFIYNSSRIISVAGGVVIIIFGLHFAGLLRIPFLDYEKRFHVSKKPARLFGVFLVGMAFAAGWSPCVGPILGSILTVAMDGRSAYEGMWLLTLYSAGLAIPFLVLSVFINSLLRFIRKTAVAVRYVNKVTGMLLIIFGVMLLTDKVNVVSNMFY